MIAEIDPFEAQIEEVAAGTLDDGTLFIARADEITFTTHLVTTSAAARAPWSPPARCASCAATSSAPTSGSTGTRPSTRSPTRDASFPWHQDNGYAFVEPQQYLTCWIALTDATSDNGCPWVVPGPPPTRHAGPPPHRRPASCASTTHPTRCRCRPGRAASWCSRRSRPTAPGPNRPDEVRKAYIVQYAPDGAVVQMPDADGEVQHYPADDARRQFPILREGRAVTPDPEPEPDPNAPYVPRHAESA